VQLVALNDPLLARLVPHAEVDADGSFRLTTTFRTGDGAPAGRYALTLTWPLSARPGKRGLRQVENCPGENDRAQ
jgi:hypothetical protein